MSKKEVNKDQKPKEKKDRSINKRLLSAVFAAMFISLLSGLVGYTIGQDSIESDSSVQTSQSTDEASQQQEPIVAESLEENPEKTVVENVQEVSVESEETVTVAEKVDIPSGCVGNETLFADVDWQPISYEELQSSILGEWIGCIYTPWKPGVLMTITFKENGRYEVDSLSDSPQTVLYYGDNLSNQDKIVDIFDVQDNGQASGTIQLTGSNGFNTTTSNFYDMKVSGNRLEFSFLHRNQYGPLELLLVRADQE